MATLQAALPREHYVNQAQYEREREIVLARSWTCAGRLADLGLVDGARGLLPNRLSIVALLAESVLVTTDADSRLHAHYNVCRHRGTQLVSHDPTSDETPDPGGSRVLRCPYHSWTYAPDGSLLRAPYTDDIDDFDPNDFALRPIGVDAWGGFLWLNLDPADTGSLAEELGPVPDRLRRYPLDRLVVGRRIVYDVNANWKVLAENYNECYHCGPVHPELCRLVPAFRNGGADLDWEAGIPHRPGAWTFTTSGSTHRAPFPGLDADEQVRHKGELIYPNLFLSLAADHVASFVLHPAGASRTRVVFDVLVAPEYVRLAGEAYHDWAVLCGDAADSLVTVVGGLDLFPPDAAFPIGDYTASMTAAGVPYVVLDAAEVARRWPPIRLPAGTVALYQAETAIVPATRGTVAMQRAARTRGAVLRDRTPVVSIRPVANSRGGIEVTTVDRQRHRADRIVVTADGWTNEVLAGLGMTLPLTVTQEQVTRFAPDDPREFAVGRFPVWIWMDDPCFYGFPAYGEALVKAAHDCGGPPVTVWDRSFEPDPARIDLLASFVHATFPGLGRAVRSKTCLYTLTPDRDFVLDALPTHPDVLIGLGAGHGFKFAPTFGRILADLATTGTTSSDIGAFAIDRPALTAPVREPSWLV